MNFDQLVVKLEVTVREPDYYQPWDSGAQRRASGTAFVISNSHIITNAHVVANAVFIEVARSGGGTKYQARVEHIDNDRELALLSVEDPEFFLTSVPIEIGGLPSEDSTIAIPRFLPGSNSVTVARGAVTRVEVRTYLHSQRFLLMLQTDAPLGPGCSGAPAFLDGKLIGVVVQGTSSPTPTGYLIPTPILTAFCEDAKHARLGGVPDLGIFWQKVENSALRDYLKLPVDRSGVIVSRVVCGSSADKVLRERDVLLEIDGHQIRDDATTVIDARYIHFTHLVSTRQIGDKISVVVWRDNCAIGLPIVLREFVSLVSPPRPSHKPSYLIVAGLVFVPLTYEYMNAGGFDSAHFRYKFYYYDELPSQERRQVVILSQILPHKVNVGYQGMWGVRVERVNNRVVACMTDCVQAFDFPIGDYHVIEISNHGIRAQYPASSYGNLVVIRASAAASATQEVLERLQLAKDRSLDLIDL